MKKLLFIAVLSALAFVCKPAQAQNNVIKTNLLTPFVQTGSFYYERVLSDSKSAQLGLFFTKIGIFSGYGITPEFRFYLSEEPAPEGFYVAPFASFMRFDVDQPEIGFKGKMTNFGAGIIVGRQWIFKEKVAFDIFIGPEHTTGNVKVEFGDPDQADTGTFDGFIPRAGVSLGLKF